MVTGCVINSYIVYHLYAVCKRWGKVAIWLAESEVYSMLVSTMETIQRANIGACLEINHPQN